MEATPCQAWAGEMLQNYSSSCIATSYIAPDATAFELVASVDPVINNANLIIRCTVIAGLLAHGLVFQRGEWDGIADKVFWTHALLFTVAFGSAYHLTTQSEASQRVSWALSFSGRILLVYATTLFVSIAVYRSTFHRLRKFPGPALARISNWRSAFVSIKRWRMHEETYKLHQRHGDYVRVGPTEISITDPDAIQDVYGIQSSCVRGPIASLSPDRYLYPFDRNKEMHHARRRVWSKAFNAKEVLHYDGVIAKHTASLHHYLSSRVGDVVDASKLLRLTSFDMMVEIMFGKSANTLEGGTETRAQTAVHHLKLELAVVKHMPWIVSLGKIWPFRAGGYTQVCKYSDIFVNRFLQDSVTADDDREDRPASRTGRQVRAFDHFLETTKGLNDGRKADRLLRGDSDLFMIAGWDNQANMMATALFHLVQYPSRLAVVREELDVGYAACYEDNGTNAPPLDNLPDHDRPDQDAHQRWARRLNSSPQLTSVIWEIMRLYPSLAQGVQRMTPPQGLTIGDVSIPGDVILSMPHYSLFRDPRSFVDPDSFRPERWTSQPELIKNGKVFRPFGTGLSPCPGRHLAMRMMKFILADLVLNYDMQLAPTTTPEKVLDGRYEAFNMAFGTVELVIQPRSRSM